MADFFSAVDVGSNAIRFQLTSVDQPGRYRILEQDRQPIRLGQQVFRTGKLKTESMESALKALREFKDSADRYRVAAFKVAATSALREASNGESFISRAKQLGIPLEVVSEEEEARLISLGIMSGLRFALPLGLFIDIGGGSVEIAVANASSTFCLFSLPLGAVRLTERFIDSDPPGKDAVRDLKRFAEQKLRPVAKRVAKEKYRMAFGSGGTVTALADTDAQLSGESRAGSLTVLRRTRLKTLLDLLKSQTIEQRAGLIKGDPKRADIIIAGGEVLLSLMNQMELNYLFVSNRGLRDGLMVDLLRAHYPEHEGAWSEDGGRAQTLEEVGEKYHYDAAHAYQVSHFALGMFFQLQELHRLSEKHSGILHAAAMLHDIGAFITYPKHHKHSYYLIKSSGPVALCKRDLDLVANVARYHRKAYPSPKHLPFNQVSSSDQEVIRKLSAILRIADGLDYSHGSRVKEIVCAVTKPKVVSIDVSGQGELAAEIGRANEKSTLMNEVFNVQIDIRKK